MNGDLSKHARMKLGATVADNKIALALTRQFEKHRIVFWYDIKKELHKEFESLNLPNIEKIELKNNEFCVKHHILREDTERKYLLYQSTYGFRLAILVFGKLPTHSIFIGIAG